MRAILSIVGMAVLAGCASSNGGDGSDGFSKFLTVAEAVTSGLAENSQDADNGVVDSSYSMPSNSLSSQYRLQGPSTYAPPAPPVQTVTSPIYVTARPTAENRFYLSDGTSWRVEGNRMYGPGGDMYRIAGNQIYGPRNETYTVIGNVIYGPNKTSCMVTGRIISCN